MAYCSNCGEKLTGAARFCSSCGAPVNLGQSDASARKAVFEGTIHKCPNCGEVLSSFSTHCSSCGYEIRDAHAVGAVRELAAKLERIESRQMTVNEDKSLLTKIFGKDSKQKEEEQAARRRFEHQKDEEKAKLIQNFHVPNTAEDYLEFMFLASSNINVKAGTDDDVTKAWISKLEQVYEKARLSMGNRAEFSQIESIYIQKKAELRKKKMRAIMTTVGLVAGWFFLMGLLWNPAATIAIAVGVVILAVTGFVLFKRRDTKHGR